MSLGLTPTFGCADYSWGTALKDQTAVAALKEQTAVELQEAFPERIGLTKTILAPLTSRRKLIRDYIKQKATVGEAEAVYAVDAIRYNGEHQMWTTWWKGYPQPTQSRYTDLDGIEPSKLDEARQHPKKRVDLVGARGGVQHATGESVFFQMRGEYCGMNAVQNGVLALSKDVSGELGLPAALCSSLRQAGPLLQLDKVASMINSAPGSHYRLAKIPKNHVKEIRDAMRFLLNATEGLYAVQIDMKESNHCVTIDCKQRLIIDTDPAYPCAMPLSDEKLQELGYQKVKRAFQISRIPAKGTKRKFSSNE
jgi:hypothetical protein